MARLKLLVVDDDEVDRRVVRRALRDAKINAAIDECTTGAEALTALAASSYDCVFLDYNLPGVNGLETLQAIRDLGVRVPVVSLTAHGDEDLAVQLMKAGAADYLNKSSLGPERLARSLRYAIALHRAEEEQRRLLEREQSAREEAQAANRAKDEFLATLSHELRTPLNAILGWAALLSSGQMDEVGQARAIGSIQRNTRIQAQLIEDLLDISRIVSGNLRLEPRPALVRSIIEAAVDAVRHSAETKQVRIDTEIVDDTPLVCDPGRMQQVVWNLLSNAIKFSLPGGTVTLRAARDGRLLTITVTDSGCGISPEFLPFVFERFRQQDGSGTRAHGGLGLGLSIVRHVVELHGGQVSAHSDGAGHGATLIVKIPAVAAPAGVPVADQALPLA